jgi:HSP20 family protein
MSTKSGTYPPSRPAADDDPPERAPAYGDGARVIVAERPQGTFSRQLALGEGVDAEHLTADYAEGVLHVTIPASPKVQPRRIDVSHAPAGSRTVPKAAAKK